MKFRDIPVNQSIEFGKLAPNSNYRRLWRKVSRDRLLAVHAITLFPDPGQEPDNYYLHSPVHAMLTSDALFFGRYFSEEERAVLKPFDIIVNAPPGRIKQYGKQQKVRVLSAIPSLAEIGVTSDRILRDGDPFDVPIRSSILTRTPSGQKSYYFSQCRRFTSTTNSRSGIHPMVSIHPDATFMLNERGVYEFVNAAQEFVFDLDQLSKVLDF